MIGARGEAVRELKTDKKMRTLQKMRGKNNNMNIFSNNNMVVFVNILKSKFFISKFSSNMPGYFELNPKEVKGMLLSDLLPLEIRREHDRFVLDFVNQKVSPIIKTGALTSFCVTKNNMLRMMNVIVKLEYFMTDDIYLSGIMIPHPRNEDILILSNQSGKVISMNQKAQTLMGNGIKDNPYKLFLSIPLMIKYFYPTTKNSLKYKKYSKQVTMEDDNLEQNFDLNVENFEAFLFNFMLNEKLSTKGMIQEDRNGILKNFFKTESFTNDSKIKKSEFNPSLILPKHIRLLAGIISKNRHLISVLPHHIYRAHISLETYQHRGDLSFKLIVIKKLEATGKRAKIFFRKASQNLMGDLGDIFLIKPNEMNNMCKFQTKIN